MFNDFNIDLLLAPQNFSKINEKADYKSGGFRIG
jgi:hypothetical protein